MNIQKQVREAYLTATPRVLSQALRDAEACAESRRSKVSCGCFCCELHHYVKRMGGNPRLMSQQTEPIDTTLDMRVTDVASGIQWQRNPLYRPIK